jgi:hypothetical protein
MAAPKLLVVRMPRTYVFALKTISRHGSDPRQFSGTKVSYRQNHTAASPTVVSIKVSRLQLVPTS